MPLFYSVSGFLQSSYDYFKFGLSPIVHDELKLIP